MAHELSVTVQIDPDGRNVRIIATGCLTEASQQALPPLVTRASTLTAGIRVTVDLTEAQHVGAAGGPVALGDRPRPPPALPGAASAAGPAARPPRGRRATDSTRSHPGHFARFASAAVGHLGRPGMFLRAAATFVAWAVSGTEGRAL